MRKPEENVTWVVYQIGTQEKTAGLNAVCEQCEWGEMERARPGYHTLVRGGITNECEAELLARGTSGENRQTAPRKQLS
jgi:hypothetical protein